MSCIVALTIKNICDRSYAIVVVNSPSMTHSVEASFLEALVHVASTTLFVSRLTVSLPTSPS